MEERIDAPICERGSDLIAFLYHEVNQDEARDFERHLSQCAECKRELAAFKEIRAGVIDWRQESLGINAVRANENAGTVFNHSTKPSALIAIRQFLDISPLWLKGAITFASILLCVALVLMVLHLREKPDSTLVRDEKVYSEQELKAKVEQELQARLREFNVEQGNGTKEETQPALDQLPNPKPRLRERARNIAATRRAPLTPGERAQLAADLRLISLGEDSELDLLGEEINKE